MVGRFVQTIGTVLVLFLWAPFPSFGQTAEDPAAGDPAAEARIRSLEEQLIAPCCWSQPVSVHRSGAATEVKTEIRRLVGEGLTDEAVLASFVGRYGKRILSEPPAEGFDLLVYVLPPAALLAGGFLLVAINRRLTSVKAAGGPPPRAPTSLQDAGLAARVERDVAERN